nr:hypothetical protein B0A51_02253 [Rachicladosporium sp. CCFEE 5018]
MGRYAGIDILLENLAHLGPAEMQEMQGYDDDDTSSISDSIITLPDSLGELVAEVSNASHALEQGDDDEVPEGIARKTEEMRELLPLLLPAHNTGDDAMRELLRRLRHMQDINKRWTELESTYTSLDCTTNGWIPEQGWWLTARCFENKANLAVFHSDPPQQPSDHLLALSLHIPQGGVILLEQWRMELNAVVAAIEEATGESQCVNRQKASIESIYSASQSGSADGDYSHKVTSVFMTAPVFFGGASLGTTRDHGPNVAKVLARKLQGGQMALSPLRYNYLVVEGFVRVGAYEAGAGEDARQCMELFM